MTSRHNHVIISCATVAQLPSKVLYELAAPSTPATVIEMVETGQIEPTLSGIREAKRELQQEQPAPLTLAETQALAPQPGPVYGTVYQSPTYTPPSSGQKDPDTAPLLHVVNG